MVTDDFATAKKFAEDTWGKIKDAEKTMFDKVFEVSNTQGYFVWGQKRVAGLTGAV